MLAELAMSGKEYKIADLEETLKQARGEQQSTLAASRAREEELTARLKVAEEVSRPAEPSARGGKLTHQAGTMGAPMTWHVELEVPEAE